VAEQLGKRDKSETSVKVVEEQVQSLQHGFAIVLWNRLLIPADGIVEEHNTPRLDSPRKHLGHPGWIVFDPVLGIQAPVDDLIVKRDDIAV
jgi:hypothetical protein